MNAKEIKALFLKAVQPKKVKFTILHDNSTDGHKKFKIICETPSKPLPFTLAEIEKLDNLQIIELETMIEIRRRKKAIEKQKTVYDRLFASIIKRS